MTTSEMITQLEFITDKIISNAAPGYTEAEYLIALNKAQRELILTYYDSKEKAIVGSFDSSEKNKVYLNDLIGSYLTSDIFTESHFNIYGDDVNLLKTNGVLIKKPFDHLFTVSEKTKVTISNVDTWVWTKPINYDEYNLNKFNPFKKPDYQQVFWRFDYGNLILSSTKKNGVSLVNPSGAPEVGDSAGGGLVYYVDSVNSKVYVVDVANAAVSTKAWSTTGVVITGADGILIGTGSQNTTDIIGTTGITTSHAAKVASGLTTGGYLDWYLPSKDELNQAKISGVGTWTNGTYWTSSETNTLNSWSEHMTTGLQSSEAKTTTNYVRGFRHYYFSPVDSNFYEIVGDGNTITGYFMDYIKNPSDITININCKLHPITHDKIVDIAARILTGITNPEMYQVKTIENTISK